LHFVLNRVQELKRDEQAILTMSLKIKEGLEVILCRPIRIKMFLYIPGRSLRIKEEIKVIYLCKALRIKFDAI
jgi:hypothetical protein